MPEQACQGKESMQTQPVRSSHKQMFSFLSFPLNICPSNTLSIPCQFVHLLLFVLSKHYGPCLSLSNLSVIRPSEFCVRKQQVWFRSSRSIIHGESYLLAFPFNGSAGAGPLVHHLNSLLPQKPLSQGNAM